MGVLASLEGIVEVQQTGASGWQRPSLNAAMCQGDTVRVGARSRAALALVNDAILRLDQNTTMRLTDVVREPAKKSVLSLISGVFQSFSRKPRRLEVNTAYLNGSIEGTEFVIERRGEKAILTVLEGRVVASNARGRITVSSGQAAEGTETTAPGRRVVARPRDAVQWGLYYPPVLAGAGDDGSPARRAAALLNVGRVDEARAEIDRAIAGNSNAALAHALRAIINVVQNRNDAALTEARRAVELSPRSVAAMIALSYALQAGFQLEQARDVLLQAVKDSPGDALAWARLSELWLSLGYRDRSRDAAATATRLAPNLARTHTVLGFAALTEFRIGTASAAFSKAIALAPSDPLPRLGLGLARINNGAVEAGRREIEIAVGLGSDNALLRSYLGKAYFEERRAPLDGEQLAIAKKLDPNDPTPWLYDALRKQSEGRPGEALRDIQASTERNDNRAVYRSRLLLDQDRAARGSSAARIYNDLGYHQLGTNEATRSLALDPANSSAHRYLSDVYKGVSRRDIARVSELLQAQLMQDVNINPVQPSLSETNLNLATGGGPAQAGFSEFTPLFERNRAQLNASGVLGNYRTRGDEIVASALYDRFSISAGQFHYQSDGFRSNFDTQHNIYDIYAQAAVTPELNIQAEFRRRDTREGDLFINFDPTVFLDRKSRDFDQDTMRVGAKYSPSPASNFLLSYIHSDQEVDSSETVPTFVAGLSPIFGLFDLLSTAASKVDSDQIEAQYLYRAPRYNVTSGYSYAQVDGESVTNSVFTSGVLAGTVLAIPDPNLDSRHHHGYLYSNINLPSPVTWTLGFSYDDYGQTGLDVIEANAKFGVQWQVIEDLKLRAAFIQFVKPALASNQVLEPTQVAGFNQFFDDVNGTRSTLYGVGLDWHVTPGLWVGTEATMRNMDEPIVFAAGTVSSVELEKRDEQLNRLYLNWMPMPEWAFGAELVYDRYSSKPGRSPNKPLEVETVSAPVTARYFHHSGAFAGAGVTYVHQVVTRGPSATDPEGAEGFVTVDAAIGYRIPNRRGIVSIEARNLFDEHFKFQDDSYREFADAPHVGPYVPGRAVFGRVTLNY